MTAWFALRTAPQREFAVEQILSRYGLTAFVPTETKWRKVPGTVRRKKPVTYAMLPRYLFVACDCPYADILYQPWCRNVSGVVSVDGRPAVIRPDAIERLALRSGAAIPTRSTAVHRSFNAGDKVEIVEGPFKGWCVELTEIKGDVGRVLLKMFGTERTVEVSLSQLEAA